jgi:NAD(P)-dependent dehydrogenase (short-subunit alcohol dehydrogenase family)
MKTKTSIIIGGTKGIGSVITKKLKSRGDNTFVFSRNGNNKLKNLKLDLLDEGQIEKTFLKNFSKKKVDNLIFSHRYRGNDKDEDFQISLHSVEQIIDLMKKKLSKNSSIIIINSIAVKTIVDDQPQRYHVIRGGLEQLTKYAAIKLGKNGTRVNSILVTKIIKPENKNFFLKKNNKVRKMIEKITPLGRMGTAEDVANLVDFLTNDKSNFITGLSIPIDGGTHLLSQESITKIKF